MPTEGWNKLVPTIYGIEQCQLHHEDIQPSAVKWRRFFCMSYNVPGLPNPP